MRGEHCVETYRLSVCLGDVRFEPDLKLVLDTGFQDSLMAKVIPTGTVRCWTWRPTCWDDGPVPYRSWFFGARSHGCSFH